MVHQFLGFNGFISDYDLPKTVLLRSWISYTCHISSRLFTIIINSPSVQFKTCIEW